MQHLFALKNYFFSSDALRKFDLQLSEHADRASPFRRELLFLSTFSSVAADRLLPELLLLLSKLVPKWVYFTILLWMDFLHVYSRLNVNLNSVWTVTKLSNLSEHFQWLEMTWLCVGIFIPASQIPILVTALGIHYFSSSCQKQTKQTYMNNFIQQQSFHHDAPNSHVPVINIIAFLVHAPSITSYHSRQRICKTCL